MNKLLMSAVLPLLFALPSAHAADSEAEKNLKAFPPAQKGMVRYVLNLPAAADESIAQVQLLVGKTAKVDEHNRYFLGGRIQAENIKGWGYTRYVVPKVGPMAGTLMAVDPNAPKQDRFVSLGGEPYLVRYNSRLPIVVYVPEGTEVRYRIWWAEPDLKVMPKG